MSTVHWIGRKGTGERFCARLWGQGLRVTEEHTLGVMAATKRHGKTLVADIQLISEHPTTYSITV